MDNVGFIDEIWELADIIFIKPPLCSSNDKNDKEGNIAVNFQHGFYYMVEEDKVLYISSASNPHL